MDPVSVVLQAAVSVVTVVSIWLTGNKLVSGPALALVGDVLFATLNLYTGLWWLIPLMITVTAIHVRNLVKWHKEAQ